VIPFFFPERNICSFGNRSFKMSVRPRAVVGSNPFLALRDIERHIDGDDLAYVFNDAICRPPARLVAFLVGACPALKTLHAYGWGTLANNRRSAPRI